MNDLIGLNDAIELVMQRTGLTREQAARDVLEAIRKGKLPVTSVDPRTGKRQPVPPEIFSFRRH